MPCHSDDATTDLSSYLSSPTKEDANRLFSTLEGSQAERLEEADKQILKWAGKLEMESIDLRDKSSRFLKVLKSNSVELCGLVHKINGVLMKESDVKEIKDSMGKISSRLTNIETQLEKEDGMTTSLSTVKDNERYFKEIEENIKKHIDSNQKKTIERFECAQEFLFSIARQLEDTQAVLISVTKGINSLCGRQDTLEKRLGNFEHAERLSSKERNILTAVSLHGTTLLNDVEDEIKPNLLPVTSSMSKNREKRSRRQSVYDTPSKRYGKRRNLAQARTIIPWEEIEAYND